MNLNSPSMRLGGLHQAWLYATGTLLVLSGTLWLLFHYYVRIPGEFGDKAHVLEPWWLVIHGISAAAFLIGFGSVLPGHVRRAWNGRRNRISGSLFFGLLVLLALSGYALYYTGDEAARAAVSVMHWVAGLGAPAFMGWHVWRGRAWRRIRAEAAAPMEAAEAEPVVRLVRKP
jgi:hypothetical protein